MKVVAFMPVYNERDILPFVLTHMLSQGIHVHVIDNWSTDGTFEMLYQWQGVGVTVERFPASGPTEQFSSRDLQARVEELAAASDADWCYLSDADEIRRSNRDGERLVDAIARVDAAGYNCIDHQVFAFFCTDDKWNGQNPEEYFTHYNISDPICRVPQEKLWKNTGRPIKLTNTGGHRVEFGDKRVYPEPFTMKHYPHRTPAQAKARHESRLRRRPESERKAGLQTHYDQIPADSSFCWNPNELFTWPKERLKLATPMVPGTKPTFSILHTSARPDAWRAVYDAWMANAVHPEDVEYILVIDPRWGFPTVNSGDSSCVFGMRIQDLVVVNVGRMCYVDGVNLAAQAASGKVFIVVADDQFPCEQWDLVLLQHDKERDYHLPLSGEFVARVNTGTPQERERNIAVMPIVSKVRYDRLGYLFYPGYESMFADNDLAEHAQQDGCMVELDTPVFPHRHAWFDKSVPFDAAYTRQNRQEAYEIGARVLADRRASGFGSKLAVVPSASIANTGQNLAICLPGEWFHSSWVAENALQLCCHLFSRFRNVWPVMPVVSDVYKMRHLTFEYIKKLPQAVDKVLWIDDDNLLTAAQFEMLLNDLETHPELAGVVGWCWIHPDARMSCGAFTPEQGAISYDYQKVMDADGDLVPIDWSGFPVVLHRASVIEAIGPFPFRPILNDGWTTGMSGEDTSFFERAGEKGLKFCVDRRVKVPHLKYGNPEPDWMMKGERKGTAMNEDVTPENCSHIGAFSVKSPTILDKVRRVVGL